MSNQNKTSILAMFGFPLIGLIADWAIMKWHGTPAWGWIAFAALVFVVPIALIPKAVSDQNDDLVYKWIAIAVFAPIVILTFSA